METKPFEFNAQCLPAKLADFTVKEASAGWLVLEYAGCAIYIHNSGALCVDLYSHDNESEYPNVSCCLPSA